MVKLIIIIVLARFFAEVRSDQLDLRDLIKAGLLVGVPLVLILKQPDLGTALVLIPMLVVGAFLAGLQWQHAAVFSLAGILLVGAVFYSPISRRILKPYQRERITSFLHPEEDAKGAGYQLLQSKIAVGSGGFWGKDSAMAVRTNWATSPSGIRISSCRRGLKNRDLGRASGSGAVYGASAAFGAECSTRERSRGNVSGHGRRSGAWVPCTGKRAMVIGAMPVTASRCR